MDAKSRFAHDIFISYAHRDDEKDTFDVRWVSEFVQHLTTALNQEGYFDDLRIFRDTSSLEAGHNLDQLRKEVRDSAIFLAVLSPNYVKRPWTMKEFEAFREIAGHAERTVVIEIKPLEDVAYPEGIDDLYRPPFFQVTEDTKLPMRLSRCNEPSAYAKRVNALAAHIVKRHKTLMAAPISAPQEEGALDRTTPPADTLVLLGRVTDDMRWVREQVAAYLNQAGIEVIPHDDYPDGGKTFRERFAGDLAHLAKAKHRLFVQMIGPHPSRRPDDISRGYENYQLDAGKAAGIPSLRWRPDSIDLAAVHDKLHGELLSGATAMSVQKLNQEIVRLVQPPLPAPVLPPFSMVFLNMDQADIVLATQIRQELELNNFGVVVPSFDDDRYDDINIRICEAIVVVFGAASPKWVRLQLQHYLKEKRNREKAAIVGVFEGEPQPKGDPGISLPEAKRVGNVADLIAHLRGNRLN